MRSYQPRRYIYRAILRAVSGAELVISGILNSLEVHLRAQREVYDLSERDARATLGLAAASRLPELRARASLRTAISCGVRKPPNSRRIKLHPRSVSALQWPEKIPKRGHLAA